MKPINLDRRTFVKAAGGLGALSIAGAGIGSGRALAADAEYPKMRHGNPPECFVDPKTGAVAVNEDVVVRYSGCLGCYSSCGNRLKLDRATGELLSVGGNPYNPSCAYPYLNFTEPLEKAYRSMSFANGEGNLTRGTVCGRGQGTQATYNQPDRITVPLKRAGKRGEGKWKAIGWDQLIKEVTEGGKLFADAGDDREVMGFRALHDTKTPMNADYPDLGPVSNQFVMLGGRGDGRTIIGTRFTNCFGSLNQYGHAASCGGSQVNRAMTESATRNTQPDLEEGEYVLWMGGFPGATGKSFQGIAKRTVELLKTGKAKMDVLDPVLGNGCVTPTLPNINWIPTKTATSSAFSLAAIQYALDEGLTTPEILEFSNYKAAVAGGYASYTNATHLVIVDPQHKNYRKLMRAADAGLETPAADPKATTTPTYYVVIDKETGQPALNTAATHGTLEFEGEVNGVKVRTSWMFLKENIYEHTIEEYSEICGVPVDDIKRISKEFFSHGTKSSARGLGGTAVVNGTDVTFAFRVLNAMVGSNQMTGGCSTYRVGAKATADGARYKLSTIAGKPAVSAKNAAYICRAGKAWTATDEYKARVATGETSPKPKLPWFPGSQTSDNQALMSIVNQYPYQAKILVSWMNDCIQATPGALRDEVIARLCDPDVVPLHIACDVFMGEHATFADYIVPDTTPFESFGVVTNEGYWRGKGNSVRWRAKRPESMQLSDGRYASFEAFICDVANELGLPGFGEDAIEDVDGKKWPVNDACDYFLKAVANLAYDTKPVDDISEEDVKLQALDELPDTWKQAVSEEEWPKVLNVLSRGGRFWPIEASQKDGKNAYAAEYLAYIYSELKGSNKNNFTGEFPNGAMRWVPEDFCDRSPLADTYDAKEFPFRSTNYKPRFRSISMQANNPIMRDLCASNYLEINIEDAAELGIHDGDQVRVTNPTGDVMVGEAMVRAGIAKGTFGVAYGYGHYAYGAKSYSIDGETTNANDAIAAGVHLQTMLDPKVDDGVIYPLVDHDANSPGRSGGMYKIEKA